MHRGLVHVFKSGVVIGNTADFLLLQKSLFITYLK